MERNQNRGDLSVNNRSAMVKGVGIRTARAFVAASIMAGAVSATEAHEPFIPQNVPDNLFKKLVLPEQESSPTVQIAPEVTITIPKPLEVEVKKLSPEEQQIQKLKKSRNEIVLLAKESGKFSKKQINDLKIYWPIYAAAGKATGVDPIDLWVTHEAESGASAVNSRAFDGSSQYIGGMQLSPLIYDHYKDNPLLDKLSYLKVFPVRHNGDIENIIIAALYIGSNEDTVHSKARSEQKGFVRFVGSESAGLARYEKAQEARRILARQEKINEEKLNKQVVFNTFRNK